MTKAEARALGLQHYVTGKPCKRGHFAPRWVSNGHCMECGRERSLSWRATDEGKEYQRNYDTDNADRKNALRRVRYRKNAPAISAKSKARYAANPEPAKAYAIRWYADNTERVLSNVAAYQKANPAVRKASYANRRARKLNAGGSFTAAEFLSVLERQGHRCVYCRKSIKRKSHADHIIPLALGGPNDISNIQGLCPTCNMKKKAKDPFRFALECGMLL